MATNSVRSRRPHRNIFDRANEALRHDLEAYTRALRTIVTALPQARALCDCVVKETRLARALLAFSNRPPTWRSWPFI